MNTSSLQDIKRFLLASKILQYTFITLFIATTLDSSVALASRERWANMVNFYENFDVDSHYSDHVCISAVSKIIRGRARVNMNETQDCNTACPVLKQATQFELEIDSGPSDSQSSMVNFNGYAEGEWVSAHSDNDSAMRGFMAGRIKWQGAGSSLVGTQNLALNVGHEHSEGWLDAAIVDGAYTGGIVRGALSIEGLTGYENNSIDDFTGTLEGVMILQCDD